MEILVRILAVVIFETIFSGIGWVCLFVMYRSKRKMEEIKNLKYAGEYSLAGRVMLLNLIAGVGAMIMFGIVVFILYSWIYNSMTN